MSGSIRKVNDMMDRINKKAKDQFKSQVKKSKPDGSPIFETTEQNLLSLMGNQNHPNAFRAKVRQAYKNSRKNGK